MFVIRIIVATISIRVLEAIIVDTYYMPSQPKEQVDTVAFQKVNKPDEKTNDVLSYDDHYVKPLYKYGYSVFDPYTLDIKSQWEHRDGDFVKGAYNMLEADGSMRIVEYTSDKDTGFRAVVRNIPYYLDKSQKPVETLPKYSSKSKNSNKYYQGQLAEFPSFEPSKLQYPINSVYQLPEISQIQDKVQYQPVAADKLQIYPVSDKETQYQPPAPVNIQPVADKYQQAAEKFQLPSSSVPLTPNYIQRENYYKQYQNKVKNQHLNKKYKRYVYDG